MRNTILPYVLDKDEEVVLEALEKDEFNSVPDFEARKKEIQKIARNSINKTKNINLRISEKDLHKLKVMAIEEGIPYQTLAASILHKSTK